MTAPIALTAPPAPLSAAEVATVVRVLRAELAIPAATRLTVVPLRDPAREVIGAEAMNVAADRDAVVVIHDPETDAVYEAIVAVDEGFVRSYRITASELETV